ncbi:MAG: D-inositol-3-phosphate glycosyltransferase [Phycisphaerales bacterium]|nr:D-inositol-3-phosphate glycosyltransferase [Phycisphaerales bacterium]
MKILHYIEELNLKSGGPVRAVLDLSRLTCEAGHRVTILSPDVSDAPKEWLEAPVAGQARPHVVKVPPFAGRGKLFPFPVVEQIRKDFITGHDLLHVHGMWAPSNVQLTGAANRAGVPYIVSLRGMLDDWPMSQRRLKKRIFLFIAGRRMLHKAAFVHCTAEGEHQQSRKWFPKGRGRVIPNLLDLGPFRDAPGPDLARRKFPGLSGDAPAILFLSRVHYKKGVEHSIKAAALLRDRGVMCHWLIAGDGEPEYMQSLRDLSASLKLQDRVHFLGMVKGPEKISLFQASDLFLLPTSQENFGFAIVEAMAAGVPVMTTKGVDLWPELEACGGAVIVEQDAGPIADRVASIITDKQRLGDMGAKARAWVFDNLNEDAVIRQFIATYADAISERTGAAVGELRHPPALAAETSPGKAGRSEAERPSDRIRIVHYLPHFRLEQGGVVRAVLDLCDGLARSGADVTILTEDHADCPLAWKEGQPGAPRIIQVRGERSGNPVLRPWSMTVLRKVITAADVVHLHGMWTPANLQAASVAIDFGVPYVISPHGMLDDWPMSQKRPKKLFHWYLYGRNLLTNAAFVHCTAQAELDQARKWFPRGQGVVAPLVFDVAAFEELPGERPAREAFPSAFARDVPRILYLSRVNYKKGPDVLIRAAARLARRAVDFDVLIAGPGDPPGFLDEMKSLAAAEGVADRVHFLGHVSGRTKLSLYQAASVFALPTSQENFGFVFFEALACGTPLVTTRGVDVWRELEASGGGTIADRTPEGFESALGTLLADPARLAAMGQAGRAWVMKELAPAAIVSRFRKMYGQAARVRPASPDKSAQSAEVPHIGRS